MSQERWTRVALNNDDRSHDDGYTRRYERDNGGSDDRQYDNDVSAVGNGSEASRGAIRPLEKRLNSDYRLNEDYDDVYSTVGFGGGHRSDVFDNENQSGRDSSRHNGGNSSQSTVSGSGLSREFGVSLSRDNGDSSRDIGGAQRAVSGGGLSREVGVSFSRDNGGDSSHCTANILKELSGSMKSDMAMSVLGDVLGLLSNGKQKQPDNHTDEKPSSEGPRSIPQQSYNWETFFTTIPKRSWNWETFFTTVTTGATIAQTSKDNERKLLPSSELRQRCPATPAPSSSSPASSGVRADLENRENSGNVSKIQHEPCSGGRRPQPMQVIERLDGDLNLVRSDNENKRSGSTHEIGSLLRDIGGGSSLQCKADVLKKLSVNSDLSMSVLDKIRSLLTSQKQMDNHTGEKPYSSKTVNSERLRLIPNKPWDDSAEQLDGDLNSKTHTGEKSSITRGTFSSTLAQTSKESKRTSPPDPELRQQRHTFSSSLVVNKRKSPPSSKQRQQYLYSTLGSSERKSPLSSPQGALRRTHNAPFLSTSRQLTLDDLERQLEEKLTRIASVPSTSQVAGASAPSSAPGDPINRNSATPTSRVTPSSSNKRSVPFNVSTEVTDFRQLYKRFKNESHNNNGGSESTPANAQTRSDKSPDEVACLSSDSDSEISDPYKVDTRYLSAPSTRQSGQLTSTTSRPGRESMRVGSSRESVPLSSRFTHPAPTPAERTPQVIEHAAHFSSIISPQRIGTTSHQPTQSPPPFSGFARQRPSAMRAARGDRIPIAERPGFTHPRSPPLSQPHGDNPTSVAIRQPPVRTGFSSQPAKSRELYPDSSFASDQNSHAPVQQQQDSTRFLPHSAERHERYPPLVDQHSHAPFQQSPALTEFHPAENHERYPHFINQNSLARVSSEKHSFPGGQMHANYLAQNTPLLDNVRSVDPPENYHSLSRGHNGPPELARESKFIGNQPRFNFTELELHGRQLSSDHADNQRTATIPVFPTDRSSSSLSTTQRPSLLRPYQERIRFTEPILTRFESEFVSALMIGDCNFKNFYADVTGIILPNSLTLSGGRSVSELLNILQHPKYARTLPTDCPNVFLSLGTFDIFHATGCYVNPKHLIPDKFINSLAKWQSIIEQKYRDLLKVILAHNGIEHVYAFTAPVSPVYSFTHFSPHAKPHYMLYYRHFNNFIRSLHESDEFDKRVSVIDIQKVFLRAKNSYINTGMFEEDGVHLNDLGFYMLYDRVRQHFTHHSYFWTNE